MSTLPDYPEHAPYLRTTVRPHHARAGSRWARVRARVARWWPLGLLLALAIVSAWLVSQLEDDTGVRERPQQANTPDLYMENFTATTMNQLGRPGRWLAAQRMAHFPATDIQVFTRPHLKIFREPHEPWQAVSERGELSPGGEELLLQGDVDIWRNNPDGTREIRIETTDVRVLPDTDYAETDEPAVITTQSGRTTGVGMRAFMNEDRFELLSKVHTIVERISR